MLPAEVTVVVLAELLMVDGGGDAVLNDVEDLGGSRSGESDAGVALHVDAAAGKSGHAGVGIGGVRKINA